MVADMVDEVKDVEDTHTHTRRSGAMQGPPAQRPHHFGSYQGGFSYNPGPMGLSQAPAAYVGHYHCYLGKG